MLYSREVSILRFAFPDTKLNLMGIAILLASLLVRFFRMVMEKIPLDLSGNVFFQNFTALLNCTSTVLAVTGVAVITLGFLWHFRMRDATRIRFLIRKGLFHPRYGNPLHLKEGERLPDVRCRTLKPCLYELKITAVSVSVEEIQKIAGNISSILNGKFKRYAVTQMDADVAFNYVNFILEDVKMDRKLIIHSPKKLKADRPTLIPVQMDTSIDLETSGSILVAGKTRSGKTTGVISLLLSALSWGRDKFGSEIIIIDPKHAELSQLPHVYQPDENDGVGEIMDAMRRFAAAMKRRQKALNALAEQKGDAVKWWEAGMHVSFLFIDEYVALRSLFPKRAGKDSDGPSLADFDALIKRIVTMGASAGCYVILSIAEASVEEGGLPSMLKNAMSTKILFRPTMPEGRLMWDSVKLENLNVQRTYRQGEAWFSSTDGVNDAVSLVHFPVLKFPAYARLGKMLDKYYGNP